MSGEDAAAPLTLSQAPADRRRRVARWIDAVEFGVKLAKLDVPDGQVRLGVLAVKPDKSGKMTCDFEFEGFLDDMRAIFADELASFEKQEEEKAP